MSLRVLSYFLNFLYKLGLCEAFHGVLLDGELHVSGLSSVR